MYAQDGDYSGSFTNITSPRWFAFFLVCAVIWLIYMLSYSAFVYIMNLSQFLKDVLWFFVAISVILIAVLWVAYRKARGKTYYEDKPSTEYTRNGSEPSIGDTYKWKGDDKKRR